MKSVNESHTSALLTLRLETVEVRFLQMCSVSLPQCIHFNALQPLWLVYLPLWLILKTVRFSHIVCYIFSVVLETRCYFPSTTVKGGPANGNSHFL